MSFDEMLTYTIEGNEDAIIAVGTITDENMEIAYYGTNKNLIEANEYEFEIGSITKTFTSSLLCKLISEGRISLDDNIDMYLDLPSGEYYPTLKKLVTHTSGYKSFYLDIQMLSNFLDKEGNDFYGVNSSMINEQIKKNLVKEKMHTFKYSNFGISVVGQILSECLDSDYTTVMTDYIESELNLLNTRISDGSGNLDGYWSWQSNDAFIPAGAIISTMDDMMQYLSLNMSNESMYLSLGHELIEDVNATKKQYEIFDIRFDAMGVGWIIDKKNNIIWHNGGTSNFNSYIAFDNDKQVGVVILSNLPPDYKIPATVMGVELIKTLQQEGN